MGSDKPSLAFSKPEITDEDIAAVVEVLKSGWITTGIHSKAFEEELAEYLGVPHVVTVSSCTTAEEICLAYLDLPAGSRVAMPTWTFVSTALAAERSGLVPVLVDVEYDTLNLCPNALAQAIEAGVDAVVGVHFAGTPLRREIHELCSDAGAPLVEDAAHALGSRDERGMVAGQGTAGACYSFYATKNLTTAEGGAIATDQPELAAFATMYRLHGMSSDAVDRYSKPGAHGYDVTVPGIKANMPDIAAALGRSQLRRFTASQEHRCALVEHYRSNLDGESIRLIPGNRHGGTSDHLLVIDAMTAIRRDAIIDALTAEGIGSSVHFRPLHTFDWFVRHKVALGPGGVPVADELDGRVMSLPLHVGMTTDDVDRVCEKLLEAL